MHRPDIPNNKTLSHIVFAAVFFCCASNESKAVFAHLNYSLAETSFMSVATSNDKIVFFASEYCWWLWWHNAVAFTMFTPSNSYLNASRLHKRWGELLQNRSRMMRWKMQALSKKPPSFDAVTQSNSSGFSQVRCGRFGTGWIYCSIHL